MENELISRQAAIDALDEQITICDKALGSFDISMKDEYAVKVERASLKVYRETLNALPSAQPERESAKFIRWMECKKTDKYISYTPHCKCSKCGNELLIEAINYCYMCGARMEGERRTDGN